MALQWTPFSPILLMATVLFLALLLYAVRLRSQLSSSPYLWHTFVALSAAGAVLSTIYLGQLSVRSLEAKQFVAFLYFVVSATTTITWATFVFAYVGKHEWLTRRHLIGYALLPVGWALLLLAVGDTPLLATDSRIVESGGARLITADPGVVLYAYAGVFYLVHVLTYWLLGRLILGTTGSHRRQAATILVAGAISMVASVLTLSGLSPVQPVDLSPLSLLLTSLLIAFALVRYRLLRVKPVAREVVLEELPDGFVVLDPADTVVDANDTALSVLGLDDRETAIGRSLASVLSEESPILEALDTDSATHGLSAAVGGETRHYDLTVSRRRTPSGALTGRVVILRDVTARREREAELETQRERLEEFAAVLSHDLRNPLMVANSRAELLADELPEGTAATDLSKLQLAHERMEAIIEDLLTLAREGDLVGDLATVDLASLAESAWESVDTRDATLSVEVDLTVECDPQRGQELLENLFRNAVVHAGDGVHVTVGDRPDGFFVADDGPGLPPEARERAFEKGYTTADDGTGFGLAIVRQIARAHGWTVRLADGAGGACFEITVDADDQVDVDHEIEAEAGIDATR
jgi:PAS domain S-box-containing protein